MRYATVICAPLLTCSFLLSFGTFAVAASQAASDLSSSAPAEIQDPAGETSPKPSEFRPFGDIAAKHGFAGMTVLVTGEEISRQEEAVRKEGKRLEFKAAFELALALLGSKKETRDFAGRPGTTARIVGLPGTAATGESTGDNWIFYFRAPSDAGASDDLAVIVDKTGGKNPYSRPAAGGPAGVTGSGGPAPVTASAPAVLKEAAGWGRRRSGPDKVSVTRVQEIRRQAEKYYVNYGANLTFAQYDRWPGHIPQVDAFAQPYGAYLANSRKIDGLRIAMRQAWEKIDGDVPAAEAAAVLETMKRMADEYNRLLSECLNYVRDGEAMYSKGLATFPSMLHNVRLVKGARLITLYDAKGQKITTNSCARSELQWSWLKLGRTPECVEWGTVDVQATVPDYSLEYGRGGDQAHPQRARMIDIPPTGADPELFETKSLKRDQYDMEVKVICDLDKSGKGWLIKSVTLRKGRAETAESFGAGVGANAKIGLVVEGSVSVHFDHGNTWNRFQFGEMVEYNEFVNKPCFERNQQ